MLSLTKIGFLLFTYQFAFIQCICHNVEPVDKFNVNEFASGTWYNVAVSRNNYPNGERFSTLTYARIGNVISFSTASLLPTDPDYARGSGRVVSPGKMVFNFETGDSKPDTEMNLTVVAFDEDIVALYGCIEGDSYPQGVTWVSSRQENPDDRVKAKIQNFLDSYEDPETNQKISWKTRIEFI